jgi:hypothetical protein
MLLQCSWSTLSRANQIHRNVLRKRWAQNSLSILGACRFLEHNLEYLAQLCAKGKALYQLGHT